MIRLMEAGGRREGTGVGWDFGVGACELLHVEWISKKVLLYGTGSGV